MESELANLDSQIQMQQESVEAKDAEMRKIREQIDQVMFQYAGFEACCNPHAEVTNEFMFSAFAGLPLLLVIELSKTGLVHLHHL